MKKSKINRAINYTILFFLFGIKILAVDIADDRLSLVRGGSCFSSSRVVFAGDIGIIENTNITGARGNVLYSGTERVLDAGSYNQNDFILLESSVVLRQGKRPQVFPHNGKFQSGKLLFTRPDFWIYYLTNSEGTYFFTQTPTYKRLYFTVPGNIVAARIDKYGNTLIADEHKIVAVNPRNQAIPLFKFKDETIKNFEILTSDNAILLNTEQGLFKLTQTKKLYTLLVGKGKIEKVNGEYFWCESNADRYLMNGIGEIGKLESDRLYVKNLLAQAKKMLDLGVREKALQKYVKALEIMPREKNLQRLAISLAQQIYGKKQRPNATQ